jgi:hypothetical protein
VILVLSNSPSASPCPLSFSPAVLRVSPQLKSLVLLALVLGLPGVLIVVTAHRLVYVLWMLIYLMVKEMAAGRTRVPTSSMKITNCMLKQKVPQRSRTTFPKRKQIFVPQAVCKTVVPDAFLVLLSQRRRWGDGGGQDEGSDKLDEDNELHAEAEGSAQVADEDSRPSRNASRSSSRKPSAKPSFRMHS